MASHQFWMKEALQEARRGLGLTAPNPPVGAVIVKNGVELSRGFHAKAGEPHAERMALKNAEEAGISVEGATIYVTLEPCSTRGRTGACTTRLAERGLAKVVYACVDPNEKHAGRADEILRGHGIKVHSGVCQTEGQKLIRGFASVQTRGRPWVIAKTAMTLDGRVTRPPGEGQWISSPESRHRVQGLRREVEAIITSGETVRRDNPALTIRDADILGGKRQPLRVVVTKSERASFQKFQISTDINSNRTHFVTGENLQRFLEDLARDHDCQTVLLEAGGKLLASFFEAGLVDEVVSYHAPLVSGGPAVGLAGSSSDGPRWSVQDAEIVRIGDDLEVRGRVVPFRRAADNRRD